MKSRKKVPVHETPTSLFTNPFAALTADNLPPGPVQPSEQAKAHKPANREQRPPPFRGKVHLRIEKTGRGGKSVVVIGGFAPAISTGQLQELAAEMRKQLGCGGTVRDREIELQSHAPETVRGLLAQAGFRV